MYLQPFQNQLQNFQNNLQNQFFPQNQPSIQYVNGRTSADNYQMQPNSSVILMDSTKDTFYIKRSDASGSCTVDAYDFHKAEEQPETEYVTREEFEILKKNLGHVVEELGIKTEVAE